MKIKQETLRLHGITATSVFISIVLLCILMFTGTAFAETNISDGNANADKISSLLVEKISSTSNNEAINVIILSVDSAAMEDIVNGLSGNAEDVKPLGIIDAVAAKVSPSMIDTLAGLDGIDKIEVDEMLYLLGEQADTIVSQNINSMVTTQEMTVVNAWGIDKIGAPAVWQQGIDGNGILVAVVDTGIDATHPDLNDMDDNPATDDPKIVGWFDFVNGQGTPYDDQGHGTHVSGTISGTGANGVRTGVAPGTQLIGAKVFNAQGSGSTSDVIAAFEWAVNNNASIISFSGGGGHESAFTTTINNVVAAGVLPVIAAGNSGPGPSTIGCPGDEFNSATVGATNIFDVIASFSSQGPVTLNQQTYIKPDVSAPGVDVTSTIPGGGYDAWSGTSMATPHVSGTAALMLQHNPGMTPSQVVQTLEDTATDLGTAGKDNAYGSGRINAYEAVFGTDSALPRVAIYSPSEYGSGTLLQVMLLQNGYQADLLSASQIEAGELSAYNVFVYGHGSGDNSQAFTDALQVFVDNGGGMITEWSSSAVLLSETGQNIYPTEIVSWGVFSGIGAYGDSVGTNTPIDILNNMHPIFEGVPDGFAGQGATEFFYAPQDLDPSLHVIAEYTGHGGTWPAIAVAGGSAVNMDSLPGIKNSKNPYSIEIKEIMQWGSKVSASLAKVQVLPSAPVVPIITDPAGDNLINDGPIIDIIQVDGGSGNQEVTIRVIFSNPMDIANTVGYLSLDTDQNPFTGILPSFGTPEQDIGADYEVDLFNMPYDGTVTVYETVNYSIIATVPVTFGAHDFTFTLPLNALGNDDGNIDVTMALGDLFGPTDWAPDVGHGTIGVGAEPVEPPVLISPEAGVIPTIDGVFSPGEWDDANVVTATKIFAQSPGQGKVYTKNTPDTLFVLIDHYAIEGINNDITGDIWFDLFNDGTNDGGLYTGVLNGEVFPSHDFATTYAVANGPSSNNPNPHWVFEYAIPLNQFPEVNNMSIDFVLFDYLGEGGEWPNPSVEFDHVNPLSWADLVLSGALPPQENGNIVMFFFDAWDQPDANDDMINLWLNSINYVAGEQQTPVGDMFYEDFESGSPDWIVNGFWHVETNPENIAVIPEINPELVTLPDAGNLPNVFDGSSVLWYGESSTGTFLGSDYDPFSQSPKNGGMSNGPNSGEAITPLIDLSGINDATLSFMSWYEVESVDVNSFDMMTLEVSVDNGASWTPIGQINPLDDVNGPADIPYSSGGFNEPGMWIEQQFDMGAFANQQVNIKFVFDTIDGAYNGFRGWIIDDVSIYSGEAQPPSIEYLEPSDGAPGSFAFIHGANFLNGAEVTIGGMIAKSSVVSSNLVSFVVPGLPVGAYNVIVTNPNSMSDTLIDGFSVTGAPDIYVSPQSLSFQQAPDVVDSANVVVGNDGVSELTFTVSSTVINQINMESIREVKIQSPTWLDVSPIAGVVLPVSSTTLTATVDSTGLELGTHIGNILIESNDPVENFIAIPVTLEVMGQSTSMRVNPSTQLVAPGSTVTIDMIVDPFDVSVYAGQYALDFDASKLQILSQDQGSFLSQDGASTIVVSNQFDNNLGITQYGESRMGVQTGITNPGVLASITFIVDSEVIPGEVISLNLYNVVLSDVGANQVSTAVYDGSIEIMVNIPPVASALSEHTINNVGSNAYLDGDNSYDPDGVITTWDWFFGDGMAGTGSTVSHQYSMYNWNGNSYDPFLVELTVTDDAAVTDTVSLNIAVYIAGDANGDGVVNILDAALIGLKWNSHYGEANYHDGADLNNDDVVNILDAATVGLNWNNQV